MTKQKLFLIFKLTIVTFLVNLVNTKNLKSLEAYQEKRLIGNYIVLGNIKDPLLLHLITNQKKKKNIIFQSLEKQNEDIKALILDGKNITNIMEQEAIKEAIKKSISIIISNPKEKQLRKITGLGIEYCTAVVITPNSEGKEFIINIIYPDTNEKNIKDSSYIAKKVELIEKIIKEKTKNNTETKNEQNTQNADNLQRRWIIKDAKPYVWGSQNQYIDIGFQIDLYYLKNPSPEKRFLVVKTIGSGTSAGKMKHNNKFHRGFFQREVNIRITHFGIPLKLIDMNPKTDNEANEISKQFNFDLQYGANPSPPNNEGLIPQYFTGKGKSYKDFCVSADPWLNGEQCSYWLSSSRNSRALDREKPAKKLVSFAIINKIHPLPKLATGAVLMPYAEYVYLISKTTKDKKNKVILNAQIIQNLQKIKIKKIFDPKPKIKNKIGIRSFNINLNLF